MDLSGAQKAHGCDWQGSPPGRWTALVAEGSLVRPSGPRMRVMRSWA